MKTLRKVIAALLCAAILLGLCACKPKKEDYTSSSSSSSSSSSDYEISMTTAESKVPTALYDGLSLWVSSRGYSYEYDLSNTRYSVTSHKEDTKYYTFYGQYSLYNKYGEFKKSGEFKVSVNKNTGRASCDIY